MCCPTERQKGYSLIFQWAASALITASAIASFLIGFCNVTRFISSKWCINFSPRCCIDAGKKKKKNPQMEQPQWSPRSLRWSAVLTLWAHNVGEPEPDRLQLLQITAPSSQADTVETMHDGSICSSAFLLTPRHPSLWNRVDLDSSDHMSFFHWARLQPHLLLEDDGSPLSFQFLAVNRLQF